MDLNFENKGYDDLLEFIKQQANLWKELCSIKLLDQLSLKTCGNNEKLDNFQIFTPEFIVNDMIKDVGISNVADNNFNILEPSSGDGAFTCRILELRLNKNVGKNTENIFEALLNCLATIYSIELDEKLIGEQRNNIYTIAIKFLKSPLLHMTDCNALSVSLFSRISPDIG